MENVTFFLRKPQRQLTYKHKSQAMPENRFSIKGLIIDDKLPNQNIKNKLTNFVFIVITISETIQK